MGAQGRRRLSGAGRGAPVFLTKDPTGASERQRQHGRRRVPRAGSASVWRTYSAASAASSSSTATPLTERMRQGMNFFLVFVRPIEPPYVLLKRSSPRDRQREEECVETGIVEPFAEIASCCENHSRLLGSYN
jgi:hypothetical protein